jgi:hypothetical protein
MHCTRLKFRANVEQYSGIWVEFSRPLFFNKTVNADRYLYMLQNNFVPQHIATQMPLEVQWFVQDCATPPTADKVLYFLHNNFGTRVVSHRYLDHHYCGNFWPPISANLNPCDLFTGFSEKKRRSQRDLQTSWT